jgi:acyl CoA:acetate/3-ketoacid CoA transferase
MGFAPEIAPDVKEMDSALFCEKWGKLGESLDG